MARPLATAYVRVRPDLTSFKSETEAQLAGAAPGVARQGSKQGKTFGQAFAKGMGAATSADLVTWQSRFGSQLGKATRNLAKAGIAAYAAAAYEIIRQGSALEDSQARLDTAVRRTGGHLTSYGGQITAVRKLMESWGFTNADVNQSLATLTTGTGDVGNALAAETTAANLARYKHIDLASASDLLTKAFAGNTRSLKGLNISISTGASEAKALEKAQRTLAEQISSAGGMAQYAARHHLSLAEAQQLTEAAANGSIPALNKLGIAVLPASASAADRYAQIMRVLNSRIGGQAAAAAGTAAGKWAALKAQFSDLAAQIGVQVLPKLLGVLDWMERTHTLMPAILAGMGLLTAAIIAQAAAWAITPLGAVTIALTAIAAAIFLLTTRFKECTKWWNDHPLLAAAITVLLGPLGLVADAVLLIGDNWKQIELTIRIWGDKIELDALKIAKKIVSAFAWIPGPIGLPFRIARTAIQGEMDKVQGRIDKLNAEKARDKITKSMYDAASSVTHLSDKVDTLVTKIGGVHGKSITITVHGQGSWIVVPPGGGLPGGTAGGPFGSAAGRLVTGGIPGRDSVLLNAMPGELVVPTSMVNAGEVDHLRGRIPGFASGGVVGSYGDGPRGLGQWTARRDAETERAIEAAVARGFYHWMLTHGGNAVANYALGFLGVPYVYGGSTPAGWDCSGATSYWYHHFGYPAPRTSQAQQLWAMPSPDQPGALVFFYGYGGHAAHVGLSLGNGTMINASMPGVGTVIRSVSGNTGFGIPPGGWVGYGDGGLITEPVAGVGLRSRRGYLFGEHGPEYVQPAGSRGGVTVNLGGVTVRETADVDLLARRLQFYMDSAGFG